MAPGAVLCSALGLCPAKRVGRACSPRVNVQAVRVRQTRGAHRTVLLQAL